MSSQARITPDRAVLLGLLVTAAVYCRDLQYDFILDDVALVLMKQTAFSWHNLKMAFLTDAFFEQAPHVPLGMPAVHYRPVFTLWLMINQQLFGSVVPWYHLTSLLLHLGVICLVFKISAKLLKNRWTAALAALLFAFHPIHVESVSYVSASTDLLVTLFLLLAFLSYSYFREQNASPGYLAAAVLAASLAMLSKETAAMFPWILVAWEALRETPRETPQDMGRWWRRFVWTIPFFAVVAIYIAIRTFLFGNNLGPGPGSSRLAALADAPLVLMVYLRNLLCSLRLSFFYPAEWASKWTLLKGAGLIFTVVLAVFLWNRYKDHTSVRLQLLWVAILFVTPVLAVLTFVKEDWVHDRHMYLVSVPFALLFAALLTDPKIPRIASVIASSIILAVLLLDTAMQVPRFKDGISIYQSALKVAPQSSLAHRYYAFALYNYGRYEEAFREYRINTQLRPKDPSAYGEYAESLGGVGRDQEAATEYAIALHWAPTPTPYRAYLLYRLATIEVKHSKSLESEGHLREALQIAPQSLNYHAILAEALRQQGRTQEADEEMRFEASVQKSYLHALPPS